MLLPPDYVFFSNFLYLPVSCSNILLHTLVSHTANVCSSLNVQDKYSYPHKTRDKIIVQMKTNNHCHDELFGWDNAQKKEATLTYSVVEPTVYCLTTSSSSPICISSWRLSSGALHARLHITSYNTATYIGNAMRSSNLPT